MPSESIVFAPEIDERQLDRETDQVNSKLASVGEDVPVTFDAENMDALSPSGAGGGGGAGGVARGAGQAGGMAALASRIPKPIAGVTASTALPVALAGGVGVGMLSAMQSSSARLQTSTSLLGQAWDNIWRPIGDRMDELFVRDIAKDIYNSTSNFEDHLRNSADADTFRGGWAERIRALADFSDILPDPFGSMMAGGFNLGADFIDPDTQLIEFPEMPDWSWPSLPRFTWPEMPDLPEFEWPDLPDFSWPDMPAFSWPDLPSFSWPALPRFSWPSLPSWSWPSLPNFSWPEMPEFEWPRIPRPDWLNALPGVSSNSSDSTSNDSNTNDPGGGYYGGNYDYGGGTDGSSDGGDDGLIDNVIDGVLGVQSLDTGGRITESGVAQVHRGELVTSEDRLVRELSEAIDAGGNSGGDMKRLEGKLDSVNRNLKALRSALNIEVKVGEETIARAAQRGQRDRINDTDPLS